MIMPEFICCRYQRFSSELTLCWPTATSCLGWGRRRSLWWPKPSTCLCWCVVRRTSFVKGCRRIPSCPMNSVRIRWTVARLFRLNPASTICVNSSSVFSRWPRRPHRDPHREDPARALAGRALTWPAELGVRRDTARLRGSGHHRAGYDPVHLGPRGAASQKRGPVIDVPPHVRLNPGAVPVCFQERVCVLECLDTTQSNMLLACNKYIWNGIRFLNRVQVCFLVVLDNYDG